MIYFIGCNDRYVKIGVSHSPDSRLNDLQVGNPYDLTMLKTIDVSDKAEAYLHDKFSHLHHRREWFNLNSELREYIATEVENGFTPIPTTASVFKSKTPHSIYT